MITTSHNPSHFLRRVSRLLTYIIPNSERINRGSLNRNQLSNYCWNNKIQRMIIVQQSHKKDVANLNCYNLEVSPRPLSIIIELTNFLFPIRGDEKTRISVNDLKINYFSIIPPYIRNNIDEYLKPVLEPYNNTSESANLTINFLNFLNNKLQGEVVYKTRKQVQILFIFEIVIIKEE